MVTPLVDRVTESDRGDLKNEGKRGVKYAGLGPRGRFRLQTRRNGMKIHWELMMVAWKGITEMRRVRLALRDTNDRRIAAYLETHKDEGVLAAEWSLDESGIEPELTIKSIGLTEKGRALQRAKLVEEGVILM